MMCLFLQIVFILHTPLSCLATGGKKCRADITAEEEWRKAKSERLYYSNLTKKTFKNEQKSMDAAAKKLIQME